jgi:ribokinase
MNAVVVGSANTDLIIHVECLPALGDTEVGRGFKHVAGGKGANQAVCLSRLGAKTRFITRFGKDDFSSLLMEDISRWGVSLSHAVIDNKRHGGVVFILVDRSGNNTMIADLGANLFLDEHDIENARELFTDADVLLLQFEVSENANKKACELAKKNGMKVVLNPAPVKKFDTSVLKNVDVLTPNLFELSRILQLVEGKNRISPEERDTAKIAEAASKLTELGIKHVLVTLGERGCVHADSRGVQMYGSFRVKQIDSTAAGDSFTSAFALKYAEGDEIENAVKFASAAAAITVTREGAIPSVPSRDEVEDFLKEHTIRKFV